MGFRKSRIRVCTKPTTVHIQNEEQYERRIAFNNTTSDENRRLENVFFSMLYDIFSHVNRDNYIYKTY